MDYKTYLGIVLADTKQSIHHFKQVLKERKTELKESQKTLKLATESEEIETVKDFKALLKVDIATTEKAIRECQHTQQRIERTKKMDLMQLENGVIIDVTVLRKMHKKFKVHRLTYEYEQTAEGLDVHYQKNGVKGCLQLVPIIFDFPEDIEIPQLKVGETLA